MNIHIEFAFYSGYQIRMADPNKATFGKRVAKLRKSKAISQAEMARRAQLSQATVSRLEGAESPPTDLQILSKVAHALGSSVVELLDGFQMPNALHDGAFEAFYAFCPNPACDKNESGRGSDGKVYLKWRSGEMFNGASFEEINFCRECGTSVVKQCPSCKKVLLRQNTRFCMTCGSRVTDRPNTQDWKDLEERYPTSDDDIPF